MCGWNPSLFLCILFKHARLCFLVESKFNFLEVILTGEATSIEDFVVVWAKLDSVSALNSTDKVLVHILLESVRHRLLKHRHECTANLVRALLARLNDVSNLDG